MIFFITGSIASLTLVRGQYLCGPPGVLAGGERRRLWWHRSTERSARPERQLVGAPAMASQVKDDPVSPPARLTGFFLFPPPCLTF